MKSIIKSLQKDPCREREISDNERESLSVLHHLQRYFPAMDQFRMNGMNSKEMDLLIVLFKIKFITTKKLYIS